MKDDTISRQAAIEALDEQIRQCDKALSSFDISMKDEYAVKVERASLVAFRETLEYLPPAQLAQDLTNGCTDTISRVAVGDALNGIEISRNASWYEFYQKALTAVGELPSAQQETAKRIVGKSRDGMTLWYQCDMCNEPVDAKDNYCRGCGRRLTDG